MKKLPILLLLVALAGHAHADVASDGSDGVSIDTIIQNALDEGKSGEDIVAMVIDADASLAAATVTAAIAACADAATVVTAAVQAAPTNTDVAAAAVAAATDSGAEATAVQTAAERSGIILAGVTQILINK